jgi:hypothetical protein
VWIFWGLIRSSFPQFPSFLSFPFFRPFLHSSVSFSIDRTGIMKFSIASGVVLLAATAAAAKSEFIHMGRLVPPFEEMDEFPAPGSGAANVTGSAFFTQLLDHDNPSAGTFQQKFWWNAEYWAGPGSPVSTPREWMRAKN